MQTIVDDEGHAVLDEGLTSYVGTIETAEALDGRIYAEAVWSGRRRSASWGTGRSGSGGLPRSTSPVRPKSSISIMPENFWRTWKSSSMGSRARGAANGW